MSKRAIQLLTPLAYRGMVSTARADSRIVAVDGSWYMPNNPRDPVAEFKTERLPNSRFFDVDGIKDPQSSYPHMLPSLSDFNAAVSKLGIQKTDKLVIYDKVGNFSSPRVAWTFQTFGHENVFLLNNYPKYLECAYPLEHSAETAESHNSSQYESTEFDKNAVLSFEQVVDIVSTKSKRDQYTILDARSFGRFTGDDPEPRPGLSSGHAPGAKSLPFSKVLDDNNVFLDQSQMIEVLKNAGVEPEKPVIVMCGTGVTACILKAAIDSVGFNKGGVQVYDGSWTEYAQRAGSDLIVKGND